MPSECVLSIDVGTVNCAWVIYDARRHIVHDWGSTPMARHHCSFISSVRTLYQHCHSRHPFSAVVIERQLHSLNPRMSSLESVLEGFFSGSGKPVHVMQANTKYARHGLQLSPEVLSKIEQRRAAALVRHGGDLNKVQQSRLNKKKAVDIANFFLEEFVQVASIQHIFEASTKQDDLADALLQALAYASTILNVSNHFPAQPVVAAMAVAAIDQEAQSELAHVIVLD